MTEVADRTAFITGGGNGIGLGIARALARRRVKLALADVDANALVAAQRELAEVTAVATFVLDVSDRGAFSRTADEIERTLGPVSILVNNAGVCGGAPADRLTFELWDWGIAINLGGVINAVQTFLPGMVERGLGGHIVNVSSVAGLTELGSGVLYHTAKFGVVGLTEALRAETPAKGIGVTLVCPGSVATGILDRTRAAQPKVTAKFSAEERKQAFAAYEGFKDALASGASPDAVGERIVQAIVDDRFYVQTSDTGRDEIVSRTQQIVDAMADAARAGS